MIKATQYRCLDYCLGSCWCQRSSVLYHLDGTMTEWCAKPFGSNVLYASIQSLKKSTPRRQTKIPFAMELADSRARVRGRWRKGSNDRRTRTSGSKYIPPNATHTCTQEEEGIFSAKLVAYVMKMLNDSIATAIISSIWQFSSLISVQKASKLQASFGIRAHLWTMRNFQILLFFAHINY